MGYKNVLNVGGFQTGKNGGPMKNKNYFTLNFYVTNNRNINAWRYGHGCGKVFRENDFRVVTCLNKRSVRTKQHASSSIEDLGTIENVVDNSDIILSILPPEFALQQAKIVSKVITKIQNTLQLNVMPYLQKRH